MAKILRPVRSRRGRALRPRNRQSQPDQVEAKATDETDDSEKGVSKATDKETPESEATESEPESEAPESEAPESEEAETPDGEQKAADSGMKADSDDEAVESARSPEPETASATTGRKGKRKKKKGKRGRSAPAADAAPKDKASTAEHTKGNVAKKDDAPYADAFEEELSSVSKEFFLAEAEAEAEAAAEASPTSRGAAEADEIFQPPPRVVDMSPAAVAHRARLRRVVTGVVIAAGVLALVVIARLLQGGGDKPSTATVATVPSAGVTPPASATAKATAAPEPPPEPTPPEATDDATDAEEEESEAGAGGAAADEESDEEKADATDEETATGDAKELTQKALSQLNAGDRTAAIETAKKAIAADPSNAMPYLFLGSALQDLGKWTDAMAAYSDCARNAKTGPVHECVAMGGKK